MRQSLVLALLVGLLAGASSYLGSIVVLDTRLPRCPVDAVLVGEGDFTAGRWSGYRCGPAVDDYDPTR